MSENSIADVMDKGIDCLLENLGVVETERFISVIIREKFDYTKWRRGYLDNISAEEFNAKATSYAQTHPFKPKNANVKSRQN